MTTVEVHAHTFPVEDCWCQDTIPLHRQDKTSLEIEIEAREHRSMSLKIPHSYIRYSHPSASWVNTINRPQYWDVDVQTTAVSSQHSSPPLDGSDQTSPSMLPQSQHFIPVLIDFRIHFIIIYFCMNSHTTHQALYMLPVCKLFNPNRPPPKARILVSKSLCMRPWLETGAVYHHSSPGS